MMMPRHLVLFVVIGQPDLGELASKTPQSQTEMYQVAAAQEMVHRRELLLARLRERGALAMEVQLRLRVARRGQRLPANQGAKPALAHERDDSVQFGLPVSSSRLTKHSMWASWPGCNRTEGRCRRVIGCLHKTQIECWRVPPRTEGCLPFFWPTIVADTLHEGKLSRRVTFWALRLMSIVFRSRRIGRRSARRTERQPWQNFSVEWQDQLAKRTLQ